MNKNIQFLWKWYPFFFNILLIFSMTGRMAISNNFLHEEDKAKLTLEFPNGTGQIALQMRLKFMLDISAETYEKPDVKIVPLAPNNTELLLCDAPKHTNSKSKKSKKLFSYQIEHYAKGKIYGFITFYCKGKHNEGAGSTGCKCKIPSLVRLQFHIEAWPNNLIIYSEPFSLIGRRVKNTPKGEKTHVPRYDSEIKEKKSALLSHAYYQNTGNAMFCDPINNDGEKLLSCQTVYKAQSGTRVGKRKNSDPSKTLQPTKRLRVNPLNAAPTKNTFSTEFSIEQDSLEHIFSDWSMYAPAPWMENYNIIKEGSKTHNVSRMEIPEPIYIDDYVSRTEIPEPFYILDTSKFN